MGKKSANSIELKSIKTRISFLTYPSSEVLRKPIYSNKQCRNPRRVYTHTHVILIRAGINTPMGIYHYLFSKYMVVEVSQVSDDQKQALVNAIKYVCSLTQKYHADIPTRVCGCKGTTKKRNTQIKVQFLLVVSKNCSTFVPKLD